MNAALDMGDGIWKTIVLFEIFPSLNYLIPSLAPARLARDQALRMHSCSHCIPISFSRTCTDARDAMASLRRCCGLWPLFGHAIPPSRPPSQHSQPASIPNKFHFYSWHWACRACRLHPRPLLPLYCHSRSGSRHGWMCAHLRSSRISR